MLNSDQEIVLELFRKHGGLTVHELGRKTSVRWPAGVMIDLWHRGLLERTDWGRRGWAVFILSKKGESS